MSLRFPSPSQGSNPPILINALIINVTNVDGVTLHELNFTVTSQTPPCFLVVTTTVDTENAGDGVTSLARRSSVRLARLTSTATAFPALIQIRFHLTSQAAVSTRLQSRHRAMLPAITDPVIIDGSTQPGAKCNTNGPGLGINATLLIELNGTNAELRRMASASAWLARSLARADYQPVPWLWRFNQFPRPR